MRLLPTALMLVSVVASAEEFLLSDETQRVFVTASPWAGSATRWVVEWKGAPVTPASGVAIFERTGDSRQLRLSSVGYGVPFTLRKSGVRALVQGSTVPAWELLTGDRPPLVLVSRPGEVPAEALERRYREAHGLPLPTTTKAEVDAALDGRRRRLMKVCPGSKLTVRVDGKGFGDSRLPLAAAQVLDALSELCADADYRAAIERLETFEVRPASAADFELALDRGTLTVRLRDDVANPRIRALTILKDTL